MCLDFLVLTDFILVGVAAFILFFTCLCECGKTIYKVRCVFTFIWLETNGIEFLLFECFRTF